MTAVSVVMPVLNEERSVDGAIRSVLTQTFTDLELLVLDGDSTDDTAAIRSSLLCSKTRAAMSAW